jgi:nicotinamide riboside transporter PnuC
MSKEILLAVLQWMATGFGLLQGLLILLKRKENWVFLLAQSVTYVVWALGSNLYADIVEQSIYILLSILGFSIWYPILFSLNNKDNVFIKGFKTFDEAKEALLKDVRSI